MVVKKAKGAQPSAPTQQEYNGTNIPDGRKIPHGTPHPEVDFSRGTPALAEAVQFYLDTLPAGFMDDGTRRSDRETRSLPTELVRNICMVEPFCDDREWFPLHLLLAECNMKTVTLTGAWLKAIHRALNPGNKET